MFILPLMLQLYFMYIYRIRIPLINCAISMLQSSCHSNKRTPNRLPQRTETHDSRIIGPPDEIAHALLCIITIRGINTTRYGRWTAEQHLTSHACARLWWAPRNFGCNSCPVWLMVSSERDFRRSVCTRTERTEPDNQCVTFMSDGSWHTKLAQHIRGMRFAPA